MVKTKKKSSLRVSKTKDKLNSKVHRRLGKGKVSPQKRRTTTKRSSKRREKPRTKKRTETSDIIIKRTGGRREKFQTDKMAQTVSRSGTPFLLARDVAKTVSEKVIRQRNDTTPAKRGEKGRTSSSASTVEVDGGEIRKMVAEELKERNRPDIASSYSGERPENAREGGHDVMSNDQQPLHDANAAIQSKLMFDSSTQMARSTKSSSQVKH
jgi:transcriptional repressor NrdR